MVDPGSSGGVASVSSIDLNEAERARAEAPVWAYCRELCGPANCEEAVAAIFGALEGGTGHSLLSQHGLLLITRVAASGFASVAVHGPISDDGEADWLDPACALTPERLAARASSAIEPDEDDELDEHLAFCLPCNAILIKMERAERAFVTIQAAMGAPAPNVGDGAVATAEPEPYGDLGEEPDAERGIADGLGPWRAEAAVAAYCRELCGPADATQAVEACLDALGAGAEYASAEVVLRTTRSIAALHAVGHDNGSRHRRECTATAWRLAARANGELERRGQRQLEEHLRQCMACRATLIKMERAERAFATMVAVGDATEPSFDPIEPQLSSPQRIYDGRLDHFEPEPGEATEADAETSDWPAAAAEAVTEDAAATAGRAAATTEPAAATETVTEQAPVAAAGLAEPVAMAGLAETAPTARTRRRQWRRSGLVAGGCALILAAGAAGAMDLVGSSTKPSIPSIPKSAAAAVPAAPAASARAATRPAAHPSAPAAHSSAHAHRPATKAKHAHKPAKHVARTKRHPVKKAAHRAAAPKKTPATPVARAPAVSIARPPTVARAPTVVRAPAAASHPAPSKPAHKSPTVIPQHTSLPAQSAPTRGIGSSG